jgi:hypothetical protein
MTNEKREKLDILRKLTAWGKKHPSQIVPSEVPKAYWSDPEFAGIALRKDSGFIEYVDPAVLADIEFLKVAGMRSSIGLENVSGRMPITREVALALLPSNKTYPDQFEKIPADLQKDPEIAKYGPQELVILSGNEENVLRKAIQAADTRDKVLAIASVVGGNSLKMCEDRYKELPESLRSNRDVFFSFVYKAISDWDAKERLKKAIDSKGDAQAVLQSIESQILKSPFEFLLGAKPDQEDEILKKMLESDAAALGALVAWGCSDTEALVHKPESVPNHLWSDPAFCRAALWVRYDEAYTRVSPALLSDGNFFWTVAANSQAISAIPDSISAIPDSMKDDLHLARVLVGSCRDQSSKLALFSESVRSNREFIRSLIISGAEILGVASESIRADRDFVWQSALRHPESIKYACEKLQGDRAFVMDLMRGIKNTFAERVFEHCAPALREDREVAMLAVRQNGYLLRHVGESLRGDREITLEAVIQSGNDMLEYTSAKLKEDIEIQLTGLAVEPSLGRNLHKSLAVSQDIVTDCVVWDAASFLNASDEIKTDVQFLRQLAGVSNDALGHILQHVPDDVRVQLAGLKARTIEHRGRRVELFIVPQEFGEDSEQDIIREIHIKKGENRLLSSKNMTLAEEEAHGPLGSFRFASAYNSICLVGDFVFYLSRRGLDSAKDRFVGYGNENMVKIGLAAAVEDGKSEIYLIDLPVDGIQINLHRTKSSLAESYWDPKVLTADKNLHLLAKGSSLSMPQGVDFGADAENLYKAMQEVVTGAPSSAYSAFGKMEGDVFVLSGPKQIDACGGAASVNIDGFGQRWLIPEADGFYTWGVQKKRLESTSHKDDWEAIRGSLLPEASPEERSAVLRHFEKVGDKVLLEEVAKALNN